MRYVKKFTVKEWKRFQLFQILCKKYSIILTDHQTRSDKIRGVIGSINGKNINKSIDKFQRVMDKVDAGFKEWDKQKKKVGRDNYSFITGK